MLERRLQILLDEARYQKLAAHAKRRGVSVASIVRQAVDQFFGADDGRRVEAARRILGAEKVALPDPEKLKNEMRASRGRRA
ncbi:MAG TPA: antitoxin [Actinomycetota bacterium]|jgi:hypothetical protein